MNSSSSACYTGLIVAAALLGGCRNSTAPTSVVLAISDLSVPATVVRGATIPIDATVQYGACDTITGLAIVRTLNEIRVTARGAYPNDRNLTCPAILLSKNVHGETHAPSSAGAITIVAAEPANAESVTRTVQVQ